MHLPDLGHNGIFLGLPGGWEGDGGVGGGGFLMLVEGCPAAFAHSDEDIFLCIPK